MAPLSQPGYRLCSNVKFRIKMHATFMYKNTLTKKEIKKNVIHRNVRLKKHQCALEKCIVTVKVTYKS